MKRFAMAATLGTGLLLSAWQVDAQWRYTDDRGTNKVTQYKIDVPASSRDTAVWIGPIGIGNPGLSADQVRAAQLWDAVRRIVAAEPGSSSSRTSRRRHRRAGTPARPASPWRPCASRASYGP